MDENLCQIKAGSSMVVVVVGLVSNAVLDNAGSRMVVTDIFIILITGTDMALCKHLSPSVHIANC